MKRLQNEVNCTDYELVQWIQRPHVDVWLTRDVGAHHSIACQETQLRTDVEKQRKPQQTNDKLNT
jgi:hypothetical protein